MKDKLKKYILKRFNLEGLTVLQEELNQKVRHVLPSFLLSIDDEAYPPSRELIITGINATRYALDIDLEDIAARFDKETAGFINTWPGEHYKFLAGLMIEKKPGLVIEIGTARGASALVMKKFLPPRGRVLTYDIIPWGEIEGTGLQDADFGTQLEQRVMDLTNCTIFKSQSGDIQKANIIFIDAAKDGRMEEILCSLLDSISFDTKPLVVFDDIRLMNMLQIWRKIKHPKFDVTSMGHFCGTGIVYWE